MIFVGIIEMRIKITKMISTLYTQTEEPAVSSSSVVYFMYQ